MPCRVSGHLPMMQPSMRPSKQIPPTVALRSPSATSAQKMSPPTSRTTGKYCPISRSIWVCAGNISPRCATRGLRSTIRCSDLRAMSLAALPCRCAITSGEPRRITLLPNSALPTSLPFSSRSSWCEAVPRPHITTSMSLSSKTLLKMAPASPASAFAAPATATPPASNTIWEQAIRPPASPSTPRLLLAPTPPPVFPANMDQRPAIAFPTQRASRSTALRPPSSSR